MDDYPTPRGRIVAEYYPSCGQCATVACGLASRSAAGALAAAREHGWKLTRAVGLVCPSCLKYSRVKGKGSGA